MKPNDKQIALMAHAALDAAMGKAEELGFSKMHGLYGIERAMSAIRKMAALQMLLGSDGLAELGKAVERSMAEDAVRQAEDILKGEG